MSKSIQIGVVEDNATMREGLEQVLASDGYGVASFEDAESALAGLKTRPADIVICDYKLPGMDGLELISKLQDQHPEIQKVMITAFGSIDVAVAAMQNGAADFITKPFSAEEISVKIQKIAARLAEQAKLRKLEAENAYLRSEADSSFNDGDIIGRSAVMQRVYKTLEKVAPTDSSVLLYGESGTGKELAARALHKQSGRNGKPFIRVHCGALAEGVLESELFGHEKGAFTGAHKRKLGRFELAHEGTIFLDEIGDVSEAMQLRLLRVLQEREFERVGGEETVSVDVRIVAATNKNLEHEVEEGRFREDLFYRLHIVPVFMPPLRDRAEDIPLLANHFLEKMRTTLGRGDLRFAPDALAELEDYAWPGNVRELENVVERAAVLAESDELTAADLPPLRRSAATLMPLSDDQLDLNATLEKVERAMIERAMQLAAGVKAEAARRLGIKTTTLLYKLGKYELE